MNKNLLNQKCVPCEGGVPPLTKFEIDAFQSELKQPWEVVDEIKIKREFLFKSFKEAIGFVDRVAILADEENHHPDIYIYYRKVILELWTHAIKGLSENDFILAAKIEKLL